MCAQPPYLIKKYPLSVNRRYFRKLRIIQLQRKFVYTDELTRYITLLAHADMLPKMPLIPHASDEYLEIHLYESTDAP